MYNPLIQKYARLLLHYCVDIQPGDRLLIRSGYEAEPLLQELYQQALQAGAIPEILIEFDHMEPMLIQHAVNPAQLDYVPLSYAEAMKSFEAYILIKAPGNTRHDYKPTSEAQKRRQEALLPYQQMYFERTATLDLKRTFCVYPTAAAAQEAGMQADAYAQFVFEACRLFADDPRGEWLQLKSKQQGLVDFLNSREQIRYISSGMDISFSTKGRKWINSHGTTNMPSGEVYTSPVEDQVNGWIYFDYPLIYQGHEITGIELKVSEGYISSWSAAQGQAILDQIMAVPGARRFGEAAIGTNDKIKRFTRNILFDEKIGGTIHMAIGQSYLQAGRQNKSSVHLDIIADMTKDGQIFADGELIYEKGKFLID